ncbi:MAG TPA: trehalose-phosphatase [Gemmatimonadaceae bacterium]|nr:trehalose-phosphatase [Gemmatimonadaceae bacterium]
MASSRRPAELTGVVERLARGRLLVLLDVDGTLAPIAPTPEAAVVPPETRLAIAKLVSRPDVTVALVSGRAAADARRMVAVEGVWALGNHGIETVSPSGATTIDERVARFREPLAGAARRLHDQLAAIPGARVEDKTWTLSVHYRQVAPDAVMTVQAAVRSMAAETGLRMTEGKRVLELRPPVEVDKGTAALAFVRRLAPSGEAAVLYVGDDRTDEDAFAALRREMPGALTVRVAGGDDDAHRTTSAELVVGDVVAVRELLDRLVAAR